MQGRVGSSGGGGHEATYSSGLGPLLLRSGIRVKGEGGHAGFPALLDNLALGVFGADIALGIARRLERALLLELVGGL